MPDQPIRRSDLRTPAPTLEPDDVFVARLSSLAAAGANAPQGAAAPIATWRAGLAAASVAAVLVGVAWLAGLDPTGSPNPAPAPATTPSAPQETSTARKPTTGRSADPERSATSGLALGNAPSAVQREQPARTAGSRPQETADGTDQGTSVSQGTEQDPGQGTDQATGEDPGEVNENGKGKGKAKGLEQVRGPGKGRPDEHAGEHPDANAGGQTSQ